LRSRRPAAISEDEGFGRGRQSAELAIFGASIRTLDPRRPQAEAVAVRAGTIVAVGSQAEVREHCDARTEILDGHGRLAIVPGLVDAHIHPLHAEQTRGADLTRCTTLSEVQFELSHERREIGGDGWVVGWGLEYNVFAEQPISSEAIADAVGGAPALVTFFDLHTAVATPRALELAGVTGPASFTEGAEVVVRDGRPTGELREDAAIDLVRRLLPRLSEQERYARIAELQRRLAAVGLTGLHVMDGNPSTFDLLRELEANGDLLLRAVVPFWIKPETSFGEMEEWLPLRDERGGLWRGGVAKFFIDGVIDTGTGWLYEPDTLGDGTEPFWPDPDRYAKAVRLFAAAGFQCATHATGDYGVRAALDAYRDAGAAPGVTHRVEHIETLQDSDLPRFASEDVAASLQPLHMQWRLADHSDSWALRLGPERCARAWRAADLLRSGAVVPLGSDWPVAGYDPRVGLAWARLRRTPGEPGAHVFEPEQALSGLDALAGYTLAAARVAGETAVAGKIAAGYRADLTGFAGDVVDTPADELPEVPVRLTVVGGRVVHEAAA
jgi:predicted amidohydrolase YtcJ